MKILSLVQCSLFCIIGGISAQSQVNDASDKQPFLLFVSISTPHFPHETAPKEFLDLYAPEKLQLPPNVPENQKQKSLKELQGYYAHCTATDKAIGALMEKIKKLDIYDNTIIVFTTDHGEMMGSHNFQPFMKHQPYTESAVVPFLISYPRIGNNSGKVAEAAITTPDILPSLLSMCEVEIPKSIEGYDLSHIIKSPKSDPDRAALYMNLCPFGIAYSSDEYRAIRTNQYTYVKTPQGPSMLFDDIKDVYQMHNLVNKPEYADIQERLDILLKKELNRIDDEEI